MKVGDKFERDAKLVAPPTCLTLAKYEHLNLHMPLYYHEPTLISYLCSLRIGLFSHLLSLFSLLTRHCSFLIELLLKKLCVSLGSLSQDYALVIVCLKVMVI